MPAIQAPVTITPPISNQPDGIPEFLRRNKWADAVRAKAPAKIPYAGKETPAETAAFKAESTTAPRKEIKASMRPPKAAKVTPAAKTKLAAGKTKNAIVAALLLRKGGTTTTEILGVTGWPSVSVPAQAKAAGLKLRKEKVQGKPTRYYGSK